MPITFVKSGHFLQEREKLEAFNSRLFLSAVDFAEASLWLIAGDQLGQALVMLDNAIEVALKGELERIHRILITDKKSLEKYETLKILLRDAFLNHPTGSALVIPEFDIEKTIYFEEAFDRVAELHPGLTDTWRKQLISAKGENQNSLHAFRNSIVHYGGKPELKGNYVERIVDTAQRTFSRSTFCRSTPGGCCDFIFERPRATLN